MSSPRKRGYAQLADAIGAEFNRRRFIVGTVGLAATASLPLPGLVGKKTIASAAIRDDWSVDDMWGVYPRYADAIGFGRAAAPHREQPSNAVDRDWSAC